MLNSQSCSGVSLDSLRRFVSDRLPYWNLDARDCKLPLEKWLALVEPEVVNIDSLAGDLNAAGVHELRRMAAIITHSCEALGQRDGLAEGRASQRLRGLEITNLLTAGRTAPPFTATSYWLDDQPFDFVPDRYEHEFRSAVREQVCLSRGANEILRGVIDRDIDLASSSGPHYMELVRGLLDESRQAYLRFYKESDVDAFQKFRFWLSPVVVFGNRWTGPNAAALAEMTSRDVLLGSADTGYCSYLKELTPYFTDAEQRSSAQDLQRGSVIDIVTQSLGYDDVGSFISDPLAEVVARVKDVGENFCSSVNSYSAALRSHWQSACSHMALVKTRLSEEIESDSVTTKSIHAGSGVSGRSHKHLEDLRVMRRDFAPVQRIGAIASEISKAR